MRNPFVFISCGQFTDTERQLGNQISDLVRKTTGLEAFFAQDVQDLSGLDTSILNALRDCVGLITVLHPRGEIERPGGLKHIRASVWIEQEIAIATYIQRMEKRPLPVIAFVHNSVGLEGIRALLHLNPVAFTDESEVLEVLPGLLQRWGQVTTGGLRLQLRSVPAPSQDGHTLGLLQVFVVNDTNQTISEFAGKVCLPASLLSHWSKHYANEAPSENRSYRCFRFNDGTDGINPPHEARCITHIKYCTTCAVQAAGGNGSLVARAIVSAKLWFENREYSDQKTMEELARERDEAGG